MVGELDEAKRYLELARESKRRGNPYNPAITNCIMAMIRTTDALHLRYRDTVIRDHSKTAKEFQKLYDQNYIPARFKANLDGIHKWCGVVKSQISLDS